MYSFEALQNYWAARDLLEKWKVVRPFVFLGQCPYARSLVLEMIQAYECYLSLKGGTPEEDEFLASMYLLLDETPPQSPTPAEKPRAASLLGVFCFI